MRVKRWWDRQRLASARSTLRTLRVCASGVLLSRTVRLAVRSVWLTRRVGTTALPPMSFCEWPSAARRLLAARYKIVTIVSMRATQPQHFVVTPALPLTLVGSRIRVVRNTKNTTPAWRQHDPFHSPGRRRMRRWRGPLGRSARWRPNDVQRRDRPAEPVIVTGSSAFEPTLRQLAAKLAAEASPYSIIYSTAATGSCIGRREHRERDRSGGTSGRYYTVRPAAAWLPARSPRARRRTSPSRTSTTRPASTSRSRKPADIMRHRRAQRRRWSSSSRRRTRRPSTSPTKRRRRYMAAASPAARTIAGFSSRGRRLLPRPELGNADHRRQEHRASRKRCLVPPICVANSGARRRRHWRHRLPRRPRRRSGSSRPMLFDANAPRSTQLAFAALGQTKAYTADSTSDVADRRNVRDGHYTIWGYEHFMRAEAAPQPQGC